MPKPSPSTAPAASSASPSQHTRPRYLRASHEQIITATGDCSRAPTPETTGFDSAHFEAARRLRLSREETGLTQEEVAMLAKEDPKTIGRRERGQVDLGALRLLVVIERAAGLKAQKGSK